LTAPPTTARSHLSLHDALPICNAVEIARIAESAGIAALAVHGRTRDQLYKGQAEYDTIAEVKAALSIPVMANGDIDSPRKAREVDRKSTRLNSSHVKISYAVFC